MHKARLDLLLIERGLAGSRTKAQAMIMAGQVRVNDQVVLKPGTIINTESTLSVDAGPLYVSRGGEKLHSALEAFHAVVEGRVCADVGASTGGFTDCLLQHGAAKVYAIDVGKGILHWKLRNDPRVLVMEQTNARFLDELPEPISITTVDASFISLKILLPVIRKWLTDEAMVICLIKPQFEAGRREAARGDGVIRDPGIHRKVLTEILQFALDTGFSLQGLIRSPLLGPKGNAEFLLLLGQSPAGKSIDLLIAQVLEQDPP